jgi:hypothetical protein
VCLSMLDIGSTFNTVSYFNVLSVLLIEETGVHREYH